MIKDIDEKALRKYYLSVKTEKIDPFEFSIEDDSVVIGGKFDAFVEPTLLNKEFISDFLDVDDLQSNMYVHEE